MRRRTALSAFAGTGLFALAGCTGDAEPESEAIAAAFDGDVTRPECEVESETVEVETNGETREYETAATIPYPAPPDGTGEEAVREYVVAFDEAYVTREAICTQSHSTRILSVAYSVDRTETFERGAGGWIVYCLYAGGATSGLDDGGLWAADLGYTQVLYAVDETGAARVAFGEPLDPPRDVIESEGPDPVADGELVAVFE